MELAFAGLVGAVVSVIAVWSGVQLVQMTQALDAVSLASGPQTDAVLYHAVYGRWPSPGDPGIAAADGRGTFVKRMALHEDGVLTAELVLGPRTRIWTSHGADAPGRTHGFLSFRPELLGSSDAPSIVFLCGDAEPVAGAIGPIAASRTTIPREYLPPFCR